MCEAALYVGGSQVCGSTGLLCVEVTLKTIQ